MIIPEKLKIGGHLYSIIIKDDYRQNSEEYGHLDAEKNEIVIEANLPQDQKETVLIHEIFHAINAVLDHTLLDSLAEQLYQVLSDNNLLNSNPQKEERSNMVKFRKKPVVIEAFKWMFDVVPDWWTVISGQFKLDVSTGSVLIPTLEGTMEAKVGDWIIQGIKGEVYPVRNDIFLETYEPVEDKIINQLLIEQK